MPFFQNSTEVLTMFDNYKVESNSRTRMDDKNDVPILTNQLKRKRVKSESKPDVSKRSKLEKGPAFDRRTEHVDREDDRQMLSSHA
ncbi:unnamed protein product [Sphagnum balticum]